MLLKTPPERLLTRCLLCFVSNKGFQLAILTFVLWTTGLYMGSSGILSFHITGVHRTPKTINDAGAAGCKIRPTVLSKVTTDRENAKSLQSTLPFFPIVTTKKEQHHVLTTTRRQFTKKLQHSLFTLDTKQKSNSTAKLKKRQIQNESDVCQFATINSTDSLIEKYLKKLPLLDCSASVPNVVYLQDDSVRVDLLKMKEALKKSNSKGTFGFCQYKALQRKSNTDNSVNVYFTSAKFKVFIKMNKSDRDIKVECNDTNNKTISRSYFAIIRPDPEKEKMYENSYKIHLHKHSPAETLSILVLGVDGFSKHHFARAMPKTREFLLKELGALEMYKHSKLGYSTSPNVVALLTGRTNEELSEDSNWNYKISGPMDQINEIFAWSDAKRLGYRTGIVLDQVTITAFHYMKGGFKSNPVDFYNRPIVVESIKDDLMRGKDKNCYGDEPEITKMYDYWLQLFRLFNSTKTNRTPVFAYSFLSRLTHNDRNRAYSGDDLYLKFLTDLRATNALNNTVIIWFSDHGQRYGSVMSTLNGDIETNTPYLFFAFPPWFKKKYPEVMRVFQTNQHRLTSHFGTYATIKDLLYFTGKVGPPGKLGERSISLFREIPLHRKCSDAQIPAKYCVCSSFQDISPSGLPKYLGIVLTNKVNSWAKKLNDKCEKLSLGALEAIAEEKSPGPKLRTKFGVRSFRVRIRTVPGDAQFEAFLTFDSSTDRAVVVGQIKRSDNYTGQSDCTEDKELKIFCYCKSVFKPQKK